MPLDPSTQDTSVVDIMFSFGDKSDEVAKLQQDLQRIGYKIEITSTFDLHLLHDGLLNLLVDDE